MTLGAPLLLAGCAAMGPPRPPSLELPKPPEDLRALRKGDHVILTWTVPALTTDHQSVRSFGPTRICRGSEAILKECGTPVGEAAPVSPASSNPPSRASRPPASPRLSSRASKAAQKTVATYTDTLFSGSLHAETFGVATYAVEVLNAIGHGAGLSNQARVPLARTLPAPADFAAETTGQGVVLSWKSALVGFANPNPVSYVYRVFRRELAGKATLVGEVPVIGTTNLSLTDPSIEWEQTYYYHVEAVTVIAGAALPALEGADHKKKDEAGAPKTVESAPKKIEIEGDDSAEVKVFVHDVFPPAVPAELQAVFSGPGQEAAIDLVWAPVTDLDLAGYNVYRREAGGAAAKVNRELVKTPAYRDGNVASGKSYLYSVSAVDVRGNESERSVEAGEAVP